MYGHIPVLLEEVLETLDIKVGGVYVDGTLGCAGHAQEILKRAGQSGCLIGIDQDEAVLSIARERLKTIEGKSTCVHANFEELAAVLEQQNVMGVDGILLDLGVSSIQLDQGDRGFSFQQEAPLDMRMNPSVGMSVSDVVNTMDEEELANVIFTYGEERRSRKIAKFIVEERTKNPIQTTTQLAAIVARTYHRYSKIHPATRTFQALRIYVNDEINCLKRVLNDAYSALNSGGRLCVISYHSLEDRIVKHQFREWKQEKLVKVHSKKPILASAEEISNNKRARSAKMRVCERI